MKPLAIILCLFWVLPCPAQFAPQALVAGSTAISKSSASIEGWATGCRIRRGFQQIRNGASGYASVGDSVDATGSADGGVISLGDSGMATLTFSSPIIDGPGADFAVFENGFANPLNPEEAFLELAFVEVSSDGVHFTRFLAISNTQDTAQIAAAGDYMNARLINNLAGKYIGGWGTPFDLAELAGTAGLDIHAITHIRLIDVIGNVGTYASFDAFGHKINDPFPTPFPGSGFDLDAVGVIHQRVLNVAYGAGSSDFMVYPNPAVDIVNVTLKTGGEPVRIVLLDAAGRSLDAAVTEHGKAHFRLHDLTPGLYFIRIIAQNSISCTKPLLHR